MSLHLYHGDDEGLGEGGEGRGGERGRGIRRGLKKRFGGWVMFRVGVSHRLYM